ncbi:MAG: M3 family metallopeptidase [Alphaproteobacteria bacterium]
MKKLPILGFLLTTSIFASNLKTIEDFQPAAAKGDIILSIPSWDQTPDAITDSTKRAIAKANATLDKIAGQNLNAVTFDSTVVALDNCRAEFDLVASRIALIAETDSDSATRAAAETAVKTFQEWSVGCDYREDVYKAIKAFADTHPTLSGEDKKLLDETLRDYRRAGMELSPQSRKQVEQWRRDVARLSADFEANITTAKAPVVFTRAELDGLPEDFFSSPGIKINKDSFQVMANVMWQYNTVEENARSEATRKKLYIAHDSLAKELNVPLVNRILALRNKIALQLRYKSWADYQAEVRMAKTAANARHYIEELVTEIQPKFAAELETLQKMKAADTKDPKAKIHVWDWRYYANQLTKQKYSVDREALRAFFPLQHTLSGMFAIFERVLGLRLSELKLPVKWADDLRLYVVSDADSGTPLGLLYLDLLPREGKESGGGESEIVNGRRLPDGKYQAPVAAIILNFPPPANNKPSLLSHSEVEILFHEFGHALHCILTRAKYGRFAGTHVPVDFVEAPSQMLQNWVWDKKVLDTFAADYRDATKKIPGEIIQKMNEARRATAGLFYRRQFAFALLDLALHGPHPADKPYDCLAISNPILERIFLPIDPHTSFISSFRGFDGYDAGYYGYAWADAIAADMAAVFEKTKDGYLDKQAGMKLRHEIYEPGGSRDVAVSIERFLGRRQSTESFSKKIGVASPR